MVCVSAGCVGSAERRVGSHCSFVFAQVGVSNENVFVLFSLVAWGVSVSHKKAIPVFLQGRECFGDYQRLSLWVFDVKNTLY